MSGHEQVMIHQARHAAMGEMLGTIAHQWRQPLNVISLVVQNMKDAWEYGEFSGELLNLSVSRTMEQIVFLSRTIDDFRMFLNPVETSEFFNPIQCVHEIVGVLSGWFSDFPAITVETTDAAEPDVRIAGCHNAFTQVILNLLNNANDAVHEQQRRIGSGFHGLITIHCERRDKDVVISISDNGSGIDVLEIDHIFDPYFTTKHTLNGIGVGLYISRMIVEHSMNGSLWAENIQSGASVENFASNASA